MKYLLLSIIAISIFGTIMIPNAFSEDEEKIVVLETESGILVIQFFPDDAPSTVDNFLKLVDILIDFKKSSFIFRFKLPILLRNSAI